MRNICLVIVLFFTGLISYDFFRNDTKQAGADHQKSTEWKIAYEEKKTDEPGKFLQFHRGIRTRDGENAPAYTASQKWIELQEAKTNAFARKRNINGRGKSNGVTEWKERGPGNVPGRTRALFNVPGDINNNTWLAGAATGGIWRTNDGGQTWIEKSTDFPALPLSSFAADANATVIYAGTGEYISSVFSAIGNGIFKSTDKGLTWTQLSSTNNNPEFSIVTRLIVHPANPNLILASTAPHNLTQDQTSAIMRSTDGGVSWTKVKEVTGFFEQVIAAPTNFNIQYASQNQVGVWKSIDAGLTWNLSNNGMTPIGRIEIAVSPLDANKVYAAAEGILSGENSDLYYTSNGGTTWSLVDVSFNGTTVDFFEGQGFYDNTIMCDPFDDAKVYFGGVSLFRTALGTGSVAADNYKIQEINTQSFLFLQSFGNATHDNQRLVVGEHDDNITVEVRFGPGELQKAHRFTVPAGATSGVAENNYMYNNYVDVPFEVWNTNNNRQLMVSFRDQNQNGKYDLVPSALQATDPASLQSREYFYINNINYNASAPHTSIAQAGGHVFQLMYNFYPALAQNAIWNENTLPTSKLIIKNSIIQKLNATTVTVADGRGSFDEKNISDQVDLTLGVHPDHHSMIPIIINATAKTYKILLGNDGGVFVSKVSITPGISEGDWQFKGFGLNTSQFYGADKKPGADEYIGGMQDNGTRLSPSGQSASPLSNYVYGIGGDGFEVLWNSKDPNKILGSIYNGQIYRSLNGGTLWQSSTTGFTPSSSEFPFITKLANSKDFPDRVFTIGRSGVYVSQDFGGSWQLTPITQKFVSSTGSIFFLDVEVARANANIVWAGTGMFNTGTLRNLHVSADGGKTFTATNNFTQVAMGNITKLASHPSQENTAYALFSFAHAPKILRTLDRGQTWQDISGFGTGTSSTNGFPDVAVFCLYVRADNPEILWAGTEIGIVESLDNGQTWALIDDFPNVSVWDMKGQDNQVVIATHGRGIWTATTATSQQVIKVPEVIASGTSPKNELMLRIRVLENFDSLQIHVGTIVGKRLKQIQTGTQDVALANITPGVKEIKLVVFKGTSAFQSPLHTMNHLNILPVANTYSSYFNTLDDLAVDGLTLQTFSTVPGQRKSLQTNHNYSINKQYEVVVRTPVRVSTSLPILYFNDIAIIEPNQDSIVVEATKNGLDWIALAPPYDASYSGDLTQQWQTAFSNNQPGVRSMLIKHEIPINAQFNASDTLLFRWRMISGPTVTAWGWALDYITIQELPLTTEVPVVTQSFSVYPNPAKERFNVDYTLEKSSEASLLIVDVYGRTVSNHKLGLKNAGPHSETVNAENFSTGTYLIMLQTDQGKKAMKIVIK